MFSFTYLIDGNRHIIDVIIENIVDTVKINNEKYEVYTNNRDDVNIRVNYRSLVDDKIVVTYLINRSESLYYNVYNNEHTSMKINLSKFINCFCFSLDIEYKDKRLYFPTEYFIYFLPSKSIL